ncbi:unnamed protein product, partial [Allacma fusca]
VGAVGQDSCKYRCNITGVDTNYDCQCNWPYCDQYGDCCNDYSQLCSGIGQPSCKGNCDAPLNTSWTCQCNKPCVTYGDCCPDYIAECAGGGTNPDPISDDELTNLSESLHSAESANNIVDRPI